MPEDYQRLKGTQQYKTQMLENEKIFIENHQKKLNDKKYIQTPIFDAPKLKTPQLNAPNIKTPSLEAPKLNAPQINTPKLTTPQIKDENYSNPLRSKNTQLGNPVYQPQVQTPAQMRSLSQRSNNLV